MKIAFLAQRHSIHTVRWVNALAERGHDVHIISSTHKGNPLNPNITFHPLPVPPPTGYFLNAFALRNILKNLQPDLLNAHFASGYGTLARLSHFHPYILNVWGSDVYDFPAKSSLHRSLIQANLKIADWIVSTSHVMAKQTRTVLPDIKKLSVVPFGIDTTLFTPTSSPKENDTLVVGTVKSLAPKYGIDLLIRAFALAREQLEPDLAAKLRLLIVGGGPEETNLKQLAQALGIANVTTFVGAVSHSEVPTYLHQLDVYVALSRMDSESFGVAILEASACALPVVVANVGGLPEVVEHDKTGWIVPKEDWQAAAQALEFLVRDSQLRSSLGKAGRDFVFTHFDWQKNVSQMETVYQNVIEL